MARPSKKKLAERMDEGAAPAQSNSAARADTIRDVIRELSALEAERKSISEQIREIKQTRIKGDLGMKIADFQAAYRLYQLEGDARDTFFDTLRETFSALGVGGQLNFLEAMGSGPKPDLSNPLAADITRHPEKMRQAGRAVGLVGGNVAECPVPEGHPNREVWVEGWQEGQAELVGGSIRPLRSGEEATH